MNILRKATGMLVVTAMLLTGCRGSKEKYIFRETGIQQLAAGSYKEAIQSFDQALKHSDGLVGVFELDVLKYRAEAEYKVEDYEAAAHTYEVLIQADKPLPEYRDMQNMVYIKAGELDKALAAYQESLKKSGSDKTKSNTDGTENAVRKAILMELGRALTNVGRFDEAKTLYLQAITDGMMDGELYNRMGLCELEEGNLDQAMDYFVKGAQLPDTGARSKLLYNQAAVYEKKQDFEKAKALLESYVSTYGSTPELEKELAFLKTR